ncbi:MAG: hypothetical protein H6765_06375 [Candidatus Peribacteria bacterium]|nr:MAG: hypothetical protein H6765_06375 [Candidatus Peribacteria bacterium]
MAIAWTLGVITSVSGPVLFLAVAYMFGLSQFFYSHSLLLFVLSLGVLTFAPTNRVLSIDKLILGFRKTPTIIYPIRLLQLLVTIIYLSILVNKFAAGWYD